MWGVTLTLALVFTALMATSQKARTAPALNQVVTNLQTPYQDIVFVNNVQSPEWVTLSGSVNLVTKVALPQNPCAPIDPCRAVSVDVHANLQGVSGTGLTTGTTYQATGATDFTTLADLPGSISIRLGYKIIPPNPIIPPDPIIPTATIFTSFNPAGQATQAAATPSLVSWWHGEGNANDALGVNSGTLAGVVNFVPGKSGQAFSFTGAGYVEVPQSASLEPATITALTWARGSGDPGLHAHLLSKGALQCSFTSYGLYWTPPGELTFYISDGTSLAYSPLVDASIWDGNWHLVAGTYDGSMLRLYVDGAEVGTGTPTTLAINYALPDNNRFYLGTYLGTCLLPFTGDLDEVRIFSRALTSAEIQGIYNAER